MAKRLALAEPAVPILGERGVIWNPVLQPQATEPAVGQVQMNLLAQPALGADAKAIADHKHLLVDVAVWCVGHVPASFRYAAAFRPIPCCHHLVPVDSTVNSILSPGLPS